MTHVYKPWPDISHGYIVELLLGFRNLKILVLGRVSIYNGERWDEAVQRLRSSSCLSYLKALDVKPTEYIRADQFSELLSITPSIRTLRILGRPTPTDQTEANLKKPTIMRLTTAVVPTLPLQCYHDEPPSVDPYEWLLGSSFPTLKRLIISCCKVSYVHQDNKAHLSHLLMHVRSSLTALSLHRVDHYNITLLAPELKRMTALEKLALHMHRGEVIDFNRNDISRCSSSCRSRYVACRSPQEMGQHGERMKLVTRLQPFSAMNFPSY